MADKRKLPMLLGMLALATGLVAWDRWPTKATSAVIGATERPHSEHAPPRPSKSMTQVNASAEAMKVPALLSRDMFTKDGAPNNLFDKPAPPPSQAGVAQVQPEPPVAPPLPFGLLGRKYEEGRWEIFLTKGDQTYIVHTDDVIEDTYKVVEIKPPAMTLMYLPTNERQSMQIGAPTND